MNIVRELQRDALRLRLCAWGPCSRTATTVSWWKPTASAVLRVLEIPITSQCRRKVPKKLGTHRPTAMTKVRKGQQQFWFGDLEGSIDSPLDLRQGCWSWWRREMLRDAMNFSEAMPCMWTFRTKIPLVGGLKHCLFFHLLGIKIPQLANIVQRGWNRQQDHFGNLSTWLWYALVISKWVMDQWIQK